MDQTSIGELRLLTKELSGIWGYYEQKRREEIMQAIDSIIEMEESNRHGITPDRLVSHSLNVAVRRGQPEDFSAMLEPSYDFLIGGLYIEGELVSLAQNSSGKRIYDPGFGVRLRLSVGSTIYKHPLEMRGQICKARQQICFMVWQDSEHPSARRGPQNILVSLVGSRIIPLSEEEANRQLSGNFGDPLARHRPLGLGVYPEDHRQIDFDHLANGGSFGIRGDRR